jgi:hypothetical protein
MERVQMDIQEVVLQPVLRPNIQILAKMHRSQRTMIVVAVGPNSTIRNTKKKNLRRN